MKQLPVSEGEFHSGTEWMLWRPGLNRRRLRWRATRRSALRMMIVAVLVGIGLAKLVTREDSGTLDWLVITVIALIAVMSAVGVVVDYHCAEYDHHHRPDKSCFLEAVPGRFFYRTNDFVGLPPATVESVCGVIAAVRAVHTSPAAVWLDPQHLRNVHHVAWDALRVLNETRPLRHILADPRSAESADLENARSCLAAVDDAVDRVATSVLQTELLLRSWEQKLIEIEFRTRLRTELDSIPQDAIAVTRRLAETVTESVFVYITAARDLTDSGPFDWERPRPSDRQGSTTRSRHLLNGGAG